MHALGCPDIGKRPVKRSLPAGCGSDALYLSLQLAENTDGAREQRFFRHMWPRWMSEPHSARFDALVRQGIAIQHIQRETNDLARPIGDYRGGERLPPHKGGPTGTMQSLVNAVAREPAKRVVVSNLLRAPKMPWGHDGVVEEDDALAARLAALPGVKVTGLETNEKDAERWRKEAPAIEVRRSTLEGWMASQKGDSEQLVVVADWAGNPGDRATYRKLLPELFRKYPNSVFFGLVSMNQLHAERTRKNILDEFSPWDAKIVDARGRAASKTANRYLRVSSKH